MKKYNPLLGYQQEKQNKREIGFLEGKANVIFHDDWTTPEELEMIC